MSMSGNWTRKRVRDCQYNWKIHGLAKNRIEDGKAYFYDDLLAEEGLGFVSGIIQWDIIKEIIEDELDEHLVKVTEKCKDLNDVIESAEPAEILTKLDRLLKGMVSGRGRGAAAGCISAKGNGAYIHELAKDKAVSDNNGTTKRVEMLTSNLDAHRVLPSPLAELDS